MKARFALLIVGIVKVGKSYGIATCDDVIVTPRALGDPTGDLVILDFMVTQSKTFNVVHVCGYTTAPDMI